MKIAIRTLIILAAALAVAGALYALNQAGYLSTLLPSMSEGARPALEQAAGAVRPEGGDQAGGLGAAVEMLKNLAVVAAAVVALWPVRRLLYGRRPARAAAA